MVNEMVFNNGLLSRTDILFQKSVRCKHHKENYLKILEQDIIQLRNEPAFASVSEDLRRCDTIAVRIVLRTFS